MNDVCARCGGNLTYDWHAKGYSCDWCDAQLRRLEAFAASLADNDSDPTEPIADNGMTVWDGVREAARGISQAKKEKSR